MRRATILLILAALSSLDLSAQQKKRVAVMDFDYATVRSQVAIWFNTDQDVGRGVADLLVGQLVKDGVYAVIERKALDKVMSEQNFANSDRADPTTAAKIGRVLGVDAIIVGSITQFGRDDKATTVGGQALGSITGKFGLGGVQKRNAKAVVGISARMVDTSTAEILAAADGKGESKRSGASLVGAGGGAGGSGGGLYDMTSSNFGNTLLGEAVHEAVTNVATQLDQNAQRLPTHVIEVDGLVADVSGNSITVNVGSKAGVKVGDHLALSRKVRDIKDPATGKVLRSVVSKLGDLTISEVDQDFAVGTYTGTGTPKVGDQVKTEQ